MEAFLNTQNTDSKNFLNLSNILNDILFQYPQKVISTKPKFSARTSIVNHTDIGQELRIFSNMTVCEIL